MNNFVEFLGYFFILIIVLSSFITHVFVWINFLDIKEFSNEFVDIKKNIYEIENRLYKLENEEIIND